MSTGGVGQVLDNKARARYRLTRYSIVWVLAFFLLVPYEIWAVATGKDGGPLTHVVKYCYGSEMSVRWWLLGWANTGFLAWLMPHMLFEGFGVKALIAFVLTGFAVGVVGAAVTHL